MLTPTKQQDSSVRSVLAPTARLTPGALLVAPACSHTLQAVAIGLTPPEYVWITYGWYFDNFWRSSTLATASNCTTEELDPILQGMLFVGHSSVEQDTQAPIIGNLVSSWC